MKHINPDKINYPTFVWLKQHYSGASLKAAFRSKSTEHPRHFRLLYFRNGNYYLTDVCARTYKETHTSKVSPTDARMWRRHWDTPDPVARH